MKKILLVDDDNFTHKFFEKTVGTEYSVRNAHSGMEAIQILESESFDLMILDVMMPNMDGYQVLERLKSEGKNESMPVIFLTGESNPTDIARGLNAGASDYLVKPFSTQELKARINTQLRLKELNEALIDMERVKAVKGLLVTLKHEIINSLSNISARNDLLGLKKGADENNLKIEENVKRIKDLLDSIDALKEIDLAPYTSSLSKPMLKI